MTKYNGANIVSLYMKSDVTKNKTFFLYQFALTNQQSINVENIAELMYYH